MIGLTPEATAALEAGRTVLVRDARQATAARLRFGLGQSLAGRRVWAAPSITSLDAWVESHVRGSATMTGEPLVRLPRPAEWLLWRRAARELAEEAPLLLPNALADGLMRAARRVAEFEIPLAAIEASGTVEGRWLVHAMRRVEAGARELEALPTHRWLPRLVELPPPSQPVWIAPGPRLTPRERRTFDAWQARGWSWAEGTLPARRGPAPVHRARASDAESEWRMAVAWLAASLRGRPEARALLIAPDLGTERDAVRAAVVETWEDCGFDAAALDDDADVMLAESPLVQALLATLRLVLDETDRRAVLEWVRRGGPDARSLPGGARLATWLATELPARLAPGALSAVLRRAPSELGEAALPLADRLLALGQALRGPARGLADWVRQLAAVAPVFASSDDPAGAPDDDAGARRAWGAWQQMLEELATADPLSHRLRARELLELLVATARATPLPHARADVALRISAQPGPTILGYDLVWVTALTAQRFPARAAADPYIPIELQRAAAMPGSRAGQVEPTAEQSLDAWCAAGERVVLSWARHDGGGEQEAAPLLERFAPLPEGETPFAPVARALARYRNAASAGERFRWFEDARGQPWNLALHVPGGTRAIELQAQCGFRAYAEQRLGARGAEALGDGVGGRERGQYLHRLMECFWREVQGSERLRSASDAQRAAWIAAAADEADLRLRAEAGPDVGEPALRRERDRALRIFEAWLELELQRAPFRLRQSETTLDVALWGARFRLRPDRVDELLPGEAATDEGVAPSVAIIDYKSGAPASGRWADPRPEHPQLLLYQAALETAQAVRVEALAVGRLRTAREGFIGQVARAGVLPKVKPAAPDAWERQLQGWRDVGRALTAAFVTGEASVDPRSPSVCQWCHLTPLCRRLDADPSRPLVDDDPDPDPDDEDHDG